VSAEPLMSVQEAATRLGTPIRFIRRLIAERRIRFYKIGRYVRIDPQDLNDFVSHSRVDDPRVSRHDDLPTRQSRAIKASEPNRTTLFDL
jgi:excisionase family DNA binding protein